MRITTFAAALAAICLSPLISSAATVTNLNDDGAGSLRAAIAAASPGETIDFQTGLTGTIVLSSELFLDKNLSILGPGAEIISISNSLGRAINIDSATVNISGLAIVDCQDPSGSGGGGILNQGILILDAMRIEGNSAMSAGGGIRNSGNLTMTNSTISGNGGVGTSAGGGIFNDSEMILDKVIVSGNSSSGNGGGISNAGDMTVTNSTVSGNTVTNNSGSGGGIMVTNDNASADLVNVTISNNSVVGTDGFGGGICSANFHAGFSLLNVTIAGNTAANGGGIGTFNVDSVASTTLTNTLVADNPAGGDCLGAFVVDNGNNIIEDNSCGFTGGADPILGPLADNGGPTQTQALLSGSPAINQGNPAACLATDQRGTARQAVCDIGAYEFIASPGSLQFSHPIYVINETGGEIEVTVTRIDGADGEVSARLSTADGTATAGLDYEAVDTTVTFGDGDAGNKVVAIPILADDATEPEESIQLSLSEPEGGVSLGATSQALVNIQDAPSGPLTDEDCGNRIDDDGDGSVDCNDSDCDSADICDGIDGDDDGDIEGDGGCALAPAAAGNPSAWSLWMGFGVAAAGIRRSIRR